MAGIRDTGNDQEHNKTWSCFTVVISLTELGLKHLDEVEYCTPGRGRGRVLCSFNRAHLPVAMLDLPQLCLKFHRVLRSLRGVRHERVIDAA